MNAHLFPRLPRIAVRGANSSDCEVVAAEFERLTDAYRVAVRALIGSLNENLPLNMVLDINDHFHDVDISSANFASAIRDATRE